MSQISQKHHEISINHHIESMSSLEADVPNEDLDEIRVLQTPYPNPHSSNLYTPAGMPTPSVVSQEQLMRRLNDNEL